MIPIVSQIKKPNQILKSLPMRMVPLSEVAKNTENQNNDDSNIKIDNIQLEDDCSHVLAQISSSQLKVYKIFANDSNNKISLDSVSLMNLYSNIYHIARIREHERDYALVISMDLSVSLLGLEAPFDQNNDVKVLSLMPLENLDAGIVQLIKLERHVTHCAYHSGQNKSRIIITFEASDWLLVIHLKKNIQGQLELVDFELDQIDGLKDAIDITSCSANQMKGWPDECCQWLIFTLTRPITPYNFSRDVMYLKNYKFQKDKLLKKKDELTKKIKQPSYDSQDILQSQQSSIFENEKKQLKALDIQLQKLKTTFEDVASDEEGDRFAEACEEGEQQVLRVYRYGSPNFEQQQEMQIELVQTSNFIFDFEILFSSQRLFVKFLGLDRPMSDRNNILKTLLISTSDGLCYLDLVDKKLRLLEIDGCQTQRNLIYSDVLPIVYNENKNEVTCIIKSENILKNDEKQFIDVCKGNQMVIIHLQSKNCQDVVPQLKVYRENQDVLKNLSDVNDYLMLYQFNKYSSIFINKSLNKILSVSVVNCFPEESNTSLQISDLPNLVIQDADLPFDDTNLIIDTKSYDKCGQEVLDVQVVNDTHNAQLMYYGSNQICFRPLNYSFSTETLIQFEKTNNINCVKILELSSNSAVMLANILDEQGSTNIVILYGQRWGTQELSPFEFRYVDSNQINQIVDNLEAGPSRYVLKWLQDLLNDFVSLQNCERSSLEQQDQSILIDFYIQNHFIILITNKSVYIQNYKQNMLAAFKISTNAVLAKNDMNNKIAILDEDNQVVILSYELQESQQSNNQNSIQISSQTLRINNELQIHDICIHDNLTALIFFNSPKISFYIGTNHLFDMDLDNLLPFDSSQIQPDKLSIIKLQDKKEFLFMTICLSNGYIIKFSFNPGILNKLQIIQDEDEKKRLFSISLIEFIGLQKVGNFVKCLHKDLFVNDVDELFCAQLRQQFDQPQPTLQIQRINTTEISLNKGSLPPNGSIVMRNELSNIIQIDRLQQSPEKYPHKLLQTSKFGLLMKNTQTRTLILQIGNIQQRERNNKIVQLQPNYKIQKVKSIVKLNMLALCCYREVPDCLKYQTNAIYNLDNNPEFDNKILLLNSGSGESLCEPKQLPQSQIPQHIEYLEGQELFFVSINQLDSQSKSKIATTKNKDTTNNQIKKRVTCCILGFNLFNKDGIIGLHDVVKLKFRQGSIMDMKHFIWFDKQPHLAVAIHNYIQIYRVDILDFNKTTTVKLIPVLKIEQLIGVFKIEIKLNDQPHNKFMELIVADILKSLVVFQIQYEDQSQSFDFEDQLKSARIKSPSFTDKIKDGIQTRLLKRKSMLEADPAKEMPHQLSSNIAWQRHKIKYKFPYGQWCTNAQKINDPTDNINIQEDGINYNFYASSFFDKNLVIMTGLRNDRDDVQSFGSQKSKYLSVIAASNIQDQITSIIKMPQNFMKQYQNSHHGFGNLQTQQNSIDPSLVFISTAYLQNQQLPTKVKSSFFDVTSKFSYVLEQAMSVYSYPQLMYSTSSSGIYTCSFCQNQLVCDILSATQEALSDVLNFNNYLTEHAQQQLSALLDDKIAFNQKFQSFQDGKATMGASTQVLDLNEFLGVKKQQSLSNQQDAHFGQTINKSDQQMTQMTETDSQNIPGSTSSTDPKKLTFMVAHRANINGLSDVTCRPVIFADFLENLLRIPYEEQEKVTFKVRDIISERLKNIARTNLKNNVKQHQLVNIEVRELIGLVASITRQV